MELIAQQIIVANRWGFADIIIAIIVIAAVVAILYYALSWFGIQIPPVVQKIGWILVVAVIAILAVRFLLSL
jgi:hypothetical protein